MRSLEGSAGRDTCSYNTIYLYSNTRFLASPIVPWYVLSVPLFRIHFTWKEKERVLKARELDMTHPYFVSIGDIIFPEASALIIDPADDELRSEFRDAKHIMLPFQQVKLIEEIPDREETSGKRVLPFTVVDDTGESEENSELT